MMVVKLTSRNTISVLSSTTTITLLQIVVRYYMHARSIVVLSEKAYLNFPDGNIDKKC